jgi:hypothetical protein
MKPLVTRTKNIKRSLEPPFGKLEYDKQRYSEGMGKTLKFGGFNTLIA